MRRWSALVLACFLLVPACSPGERTALAAEAPAARGGADPHGGAGKAESVSTPDLPEAGVVLAEYNARVTAALTEIDSLFVRQQVIEPCEGGEDRTATALLSYTREEGLTRTELESSLAYPSGRYRLESLVGPLLDPGEYHVELRPIEEMEGERCFRLDVEALVRDVDHFDGTVWVSVEGGGPVRVAGEVADPPFPARMIRLDKTFERVGGRYRLVRRHSGEVELGALLGGRRGVRHVFYEDYTVRTAERG